MANKWWTNGQYNTRGATCPKDGWWNGYTRGAPPLEVKVWTNGIDTIRSKICPDGWYEKPKKVVQPKLPQPKKEPIIKPQLLLRNDYLEIEILPWMSDCWQLQGVELLVYALIYSQVEIDRREVVNCLPFPQKDIEKAINYLKNECLIETTINNVPIYRVTDTSIV